MAREKQRKRIKDSDVVLQYRLYSLCVWGGGGGIEKDGYK